MHFEWDPKKAQENQRKHDVTFKEAAECFADEHAVDLEDPAHPERLILIGVSMSSRLIFTVYALRERNERKTYEEGDF